MTATLHKLTAGDGYTYLTRQVAAGDSTERGYDSLGDYYSVKGEAPGTWTGAGLTALGVDGQVTEQQMINLFGTGIHPDAERIRDHAAEAGLPPRAVENAANLGQPFRVFEPNQDWQDRLADAYSAYNHVRDAATNSPIPADERERIRTDVATAMFTETHGRDPRGDRELTSFVAQASRPIRSAVAGYDVTFSPVKSVSTLWAVAPKELSERIEGAHQAAVDDTVAWLERNAGYTRSGTNGIAQIDVRGLIAAQFTHRDSRAGDPDLHTHVAISNKVQALDGRWLALDGRMIHRYLVAASEHYNSRLEAELTQRIGAQFEERHTAPGKRPIRELQGVDPALNDRFSQRRRSITSHRASLVEQFRARNHRLPTAVEMIKLSQQANLATREAKHDPKSLDEQRQQWHEQAVNVLGSEQALGELVTAATAGELVAARELTPARAAELAAETLRVVEATRSQWSRHNIAAEAMRQLRYAGLAVGTDTDIAVEQVIAIALGPDLSVPIGTDVEPGRAQVPQQLQRADGTSVFRMAGGQLYTSLAVLEAEQAVVDAAGEGGARTVGDQDVQIGMLEWSANNEGRSLNPSQRAMVDEVATSDRRLLLALAPAGTGKTTTMGALAAVWQGTGGTIVALAPQASAAQELAAQIPGVSSDTVDKLVHDLSDGPGADPTRWHREITAGTLVIVDEAGLASTRNLAAVTRFARRQGARVLLVGDDRQRAAAGAGGVLRDIEATHGSLSLDEVMRFHDLRQGAASLAMRAGDPGAVGYYVDAQRLHSVTADEAADHVFAAWQRDQDAGIASIMIAPNLEQVTELNTRARAARLAAVKADPELSPSPSSLLSRSLPNGETVSAGDLIVTKKNARTLSLGGTDFVKNNYRWMVEAINRDGSITATETTRGLTRTLPARYVDAGFVRLGYAWTTASVQGLTVDGNAYTVLTADMSRNDLYPAMTRAKGENHGFLIVGGTGDEHEIIRPESVNPQTAAEMFAAIIERDGADRSALTEIREGRDPHARMAIAAGAYTHSILSGVESRTGEQVLADLTTRAETAAPGVTGGHAWDTLRQHLAVIQLQGRDPITQLAAAAAARELAGARDLAATLDWRLDPSGNHSLGRGPLAWLPAVPAGLQADPVWGTYLNARKDLVDQLAGQIRADVRSWTPQSAPAWALPYLSNPGLVTELALWRASTSVTVTDLRPAGDRPRSIAHQDYHRQLTRAAAVVAGDPADGSGRWRQVLTAAGAEQVTADSWWPVLVSRLSAAERSGAPVAQLITDALAAKALPSEAPAAVLWSRVAPHVDLDEYDAADSHLIRPTWSTEITAELGQDAADRIIADRLWPVLVGYVDAETVRHGADPRQLIATAARLLTAERTTAPENQYPELLMTHIARLTEPEPLDASADLPLDPANADLSAPADAYTVPVEADPRLASPAASNDQIPLPEDPERTGLLPEPDHAPVEDEQVDRGRLLDVVGTVHEFYRSQASSSWVPAYLAERGLGALTGRTGYAPAGWSTAVDHLRSAGFTDRELLAAGLARTSSRGTLIDAFRDRAVLPVHDQNGQVVAFTGRRNPATVDEHNPKYINSPTTDLYSKSELPYGLHPRAIEALRAGADLAIVEGPMDAEAINLATRGRTVAVAPLGTALTAGQLSTINQLAPLADREVLTILDTDEAGRAAAVRAHQLLHEAGVDDAHNVALPDGAKDPAETLQSHGGDRLITAVTQDRVPLADLAVDDVLSRWPAPTTPEYRIGALEEAAPLVAGLPGDIRDRQIERMATALDLHAGTVTEAVAEHIAPPPSPSSNLGLPQRPTLHTSIADRTELSTEELRAQAQRLDRELTSVRDQRNGLNQRVQQIAAHEPGHAEQQRQARVLDHDAAINERSAVVEHLERLNAQWAHRSEPLGTETAGSQVQHDAAAHFADRLAAITPAEADPSTSVPTVDLYGQVVETETDLRRVNDQHRTNSELIERLRTHPSAVETQRRQQELATRAEHVHTYRAAAAEMAALRQTTSGRVQEIAETELRVAEGGRRAARRDGEQLAELRRRQDTDRAAMQRAAQTMGGLHQVVGSTADQEAVLAEHQRNVEHGPQHVAAAAAQDDVQLARRTELANTFQERIVAAQDRLAVDRAELALRPEEERVAAEQQLDKSGPGADVTWQSRAPEPTVEHDIEW